MFDIGWSELLVIGAIALIVVGPKDLPAMLRNLGRYAGKARSMAREFQRSMEDAAREADLSELRDVQKSMRDFDRKIGLGDPKKLVERMSEPEKKPAKTTAPGSLDEADAAENAAAEARRDSAETPAASPAKPTAPGNGPDAAPGGETAKGETPPSRPAEETPAKTAAGGSPSKGA